jgi:hypothetical protein
MVVAFLVNCTNNPAPETSVFASVKERSSAAIVAIRDSL